MTSIESIVIVFCFIILVLILKKDDGDSKDSYLINVAILERVIDDYVTLVVDKEIELLRRQHNLDPESKINSINSFELKVNELLKVSVVEIIKLLTKDIRKYFKVRFSDRSLALLITNRVKSKYSL